MGKDKVMLCADDLTDVGDIRAALAALTEEEVSSVKMRTVVLVVMRR